MTIRRIIRVQRSQTVIEARVELRARLDEGMHCVVCDQFAKRYQRQITSSAAAALVGMYRRAGLSMVHVPDLFARAGGDVAKMAYWGLIEEESFRRPDGGRAGWWAVTELGEQWIRGAVTVPQYALIYNGHCHGIEGAPRTIQQALGKRFDLQELMGPRVRVIRRMAQR